MKFFRFYEKLTFRNFLFLRVKLHFREKCLQIFWPKEAQNGPETDFIQGAIGAFVQKGINSEFLKCYDN